MTANSSPLLRAREAADYLSISERHLCNLTAPRGPIRAVRLGRSLRYARETLDKAIADQLSGKTGG